MSIKKSASEFVVGLVTEASEDLGIPPFDLQYNELQRWCKENEDTSLSEKAADIRKAGGFTAIRDANFPRPADDADSLPMEKVVVQAAARTNRREAVFAARENAFLERFQELSTKIFSGKLKVQKEMPKLARRAGITRELHILISDTHFGSDLDPRYVPMKYGTVEEARRIAHVVRTVCNYKRDHRSETRLRVHLGGDIIQGQLHDLRDGDILAAQCARAIHLLGQALAIFAKEFPEVWVDCSTGNHDRFTSRHQERATYEKADSLATVIYFAVKTATKHLKTSAGKAINFEITRRPYVTFDSFGAKALGTHGDTVLNPGYPGSVINAKSLETQINRINASLPNADEYKLFFVGHVHVGTVIHMGNGAILITNGALIPSDQYSVSIGLFENSCGQSMWESVPGHIVGDYRFITVNGATDKDESLDSLITAFVDF